MRPLSRLVNSAETGAPEPSSLSVKPSSSSGTRLATLSPPSVQASSTQAVRSASQSFWQGRHRRETLRHLACVQDEALVFERRALGVQPCPDSGYQLRRQRLHLAALRA